MLLAFSVELRSHPYWWPTTVPTNQVLLAELNIAHGLMIHHVLLAAVVWLPVVDVVLAPVLFVDRAVIVAVHHAVHAEHVRLVFLHYSFRF